LRTPSRSQVASAIDLAVDDLREIIDIARDRGGDLLTAGECVILDRIRSLDGPAARLYARLTTRRPTVFRTQAVTCAGVEDIDSAVEDLLDLDLADRLVPWDRRAEALTLSDLKDGLRRLSLPVSGRRDALIARLRGRTHWQPDAWFRIRHRGLLARLESWYFLRPSRDRSTLVVERLGHITWPSYRLTPGHAVFRRRADLLRWETLRRPDRTVEDALEGLRSGAYRAPGALNLGRRLKRTLLEAARGLESDAPAEAREIYLKLGEDPLLRAELAPRVARTLETEARAKDALAHLLQCLGEATGAERIAIQRSGRRIARTLRQGWPPDPPLRRPATRQLTLQAAPRTGSRPRYRVEGQDHTVEQAVCTLLHRVGRRAIHGEGALWSTLFALLFADCYFLDIDGALPCRFLSGPLDLGTPAFRARREEAVADVLNGVLQGQVAHRLKDADQRFRGQRLSGAQWSLGSAQTLIDVATGIAPSTLVEILEQILASGRRATRGLPDLAVLPGGACQLSRAFPRRLSESLLLVEVKGPGDSLRDAQSLWLDRLLKSGTHVEIWEVKPSAVV
jgi:hypothetical protein